MDLPVASPPGGPTDVLTPVRALNQVSYCPRLYYLQYVESLMPVNEFVEDGLFQHRRVSDPALQHGYPSALNPPSARVDPLD